MKQFDVFISFSRKDIDVADKICAALGKHGITYFIDRKEIGKGEVYNNNTKALSDSKIFLFLACPNSYRMKHVYNEMIFAKNNDIILLPYIIGGTSLTGTYKLALSDYKCRNIQEHPIEPVLINDLLELLGRNQIK